MTEVQLRSERCPVCNVEISWDEQTTPKASRGNCPHCGKCFTPIKIRFL